MWEEFHLKSYQPWKRKFLNLTTIIKHQNKNHSFCANCLKENFCLWCLKHSYRIFNYHPLGLVLNYFIVLCGWQLYLFFTNRWQCEHLASVIPSGKSIRKVDQEWRGKDDNCLFRDLWVVSNRTVHPFPIPNWELKGDLVRDVKILMLTCHFVSCSPHPKDLI